MSGRIGNPPLRYNDENFSCNFISLRPRPAVYSGGQSAGGAVHYLVLYYLLQPYTAGLENTSFGYRLITGLTYFVCYMIYANVHGATMAFGIGMIVFAAAYVAAALLLAYRLAPRTFKLRT